MASTIPAASPAAPSPTREIPVLADGVELLGEYEDSGFREPPLLARRGDGQMIKLTPLLYAVAAGCDGHRDPEQVAAVVSEHTGRGVSAGNIRHLVEKQLRPLGVLARADGTTPELPKRRALFALRHRRPILQAGAVNAVAALFTWLHLRPIKALLLALLLLFDAWLFAVHGIAGGIRSVLYEPAWLLAVLVSVVVATAFHEVGHASACRFSGARPGEMGVGVYLIWPAFYCDVTEAYQLNRRGRLRTDLGGVYFNGLFALACGTAYMATGHEALLFAAFVQHMIVLQQLLPLLRFDGYYVLSDLTGVPDILSRVKPIFRSLVRGRRHEPKVAELKPWVRVVVTLYLIVLIPMLALMIGSIVTSAPRTFATAYDSFWLQLDRLHGSHGWAELGVGAFRIAALIMPLGAMCLSVSRSAKMGLRGINGWSRGSAPRRAVAAAGLVLLVGGIAYIWLPNGDYEPIRPGERGTIGEAIKAVPDIPSGRPSFTPERAAVFSTVPTVREGGSAVHPHGRDGGRGDGDGAGGDGGAITTPAPGADPGEDGTDGGESAPGIDVGSNDTTGGESPSATPSPAGTGSSPTPAPTGGSTPAGQPSPSATAPAPTPTATPTPTPTPSPQPTATSTPTQESSSTTPVPDATVPATPTPLPSAEPLQASPTPLPTP